MMCCDLSFERVQPLRIVFELIPEIEEVPKGRRHRADPHLQRVTVIDQFRSDHGADGFDLPHFIRIGLRRAAARGFRGKPFDEEIDLINMNLVVAARADEIRLNLGNGLLGVHEFVADSVFPVHGCLVAPVQICSLKIEVARCDVGWQTGWARIVRLE